MSTSIPPRGPSTPSRTPLAPSFWSNPRVIVGSLLGLVVLALLAWSLQGGGGESIASAYGRRGGSDGSNSVNGTRVLATMFEKLGCQVSTVQRLSPRLQKTADVIVWFPDDFGAPPAKTQEYVEKWLSQGADRTLIYVGRDYSATPLYWREAEALAESSDKERFAANRARAQSDHERTRSEIPNDDYAQWFTIHGKGKKRQVTTLDGPWAEGLQPTQTMIEIEGRLDEPTAADYAVVGAPSPPYVFRNLLRSQNDPLIAEVTRSGWNRSRILLVTNGSFLLNYPLVNHENRKLAAHLIKDCQDHNQFSNPLRVVFVESGRGGPVIIENENETDEAGLQILKVWPLNAILLHFILLGIVYCFSRTSIFGRPKTIPQEPQANFGKHVAALGSLLARTRDRVYAENRLQQYLQQAKRNSGKSHLKG